MKFRGNRPNGFCKVVNNSMILYMYTAQRQGKIPGRIKFWFLLRAFAYSIIYCKF